MRQDRIDIQVDPQGMVGPTHPPTGASTFADVKEAPLTGHYHVLPKGTALPEGLAIVADGVDVGGSQPRTHHTVYPTRTMKYEEFVEKYMSLPWSHAGKKK